MIASDVKVQVKWKRAGTYLIILILILLTLEIILEDITLIGRENVD